MNVKFVCWFLIEQTAQPRPARLLKDPGLCKSTTRQEVVHSAAASEG